MAPAATVCLYRGPIRLPTGDGLAEDMITVNISRVVPEGSDSTGVMAGSITNADAAGSFDWAEYAGTYSEARVIAMQSEWLPYYDRTYTTSHTPGNGLIAVAHTTPVLIPTSISEVVQRTSHKAFYSGSSIVIHYRMNSSEEGAWSNTAGGPIGHGGFMWYINNLDASTVQGQFIHTFLVQFRNRK